MLRSIFAASLAAPLLCALTNSAALAQSVSPSVTSIAADPAQSADALQEVTVTARRKDENLQSVPVAVTAFSADALALHNIDSIAALGPLTPSLTFSSSTYGVLGTNVAIRGQRPNDLDLSQTPAVGVYIDDVYQSSTMGLSAVGLSNASSVEVLKGPQGTLYGRNTTGGAIKVTTQLPDYNSPSGSVRLGAGNESDVRAYGELSLPVINDRVAFGLTANYDKNNGYGRDVASGTYIGNTDMKSVNAALRVRLSDQFEAILRSDYISASSGGLLYSLTSVVPNGGLNSVAAFQLGYGLTSAGLTNALNYLRGHYVHQGGTDRQYNGPLYQRVVQTSQSLTLRYDLTDKVNIKSITAYQRVGDDIDGDNDGTPFRTVDGDFENMLTHQTTEELQLNGTSIGDALSYTAGYFYYRLPGEETAFANVLYPLLATQLRNDNQIVDKSNSGYAQATLEILPTLRATAGLRYTDENTTLVSRNHVAVPAGVLCNVPVPDRVNDECAAPFATASSDWSYTAGLDWDVADGVLVYAKTSRGYKAGGINQRGDVNGGFNTFLPEQVTDYEVGAKSEFWGDRVRLNVAAYYSKYINIQRTVLVAGLSGAPETVVLNAAGARIRGAELELTVRPVPRLTLSASGSYIGAGYNQYVNPLTLADYSHHVFPGVPRWQGALSANYEYPTGLGPLTGALDLSYQSKVNYSPDNNLPPSADFPDGTAPFTSQGGFALLNGRLSWMLSGPDLTLSLWGRNLANKTFFAGGDDFSGTLGFATLFRGPPRTFGGEITKRF